LSPGVGAAVTTTILIGVIIRRKDLIHLMALTIIRRRMAESQITAIPITATVQITVTNLHRPGDLCNNIVELKRLE
jgi:hypothetical protein